MNYEQQKFGEATDSRSSIHEDQIRQPSQHQEPEPETPAEQVESQDDSAELNTSTEEEKPTESNEDQQDATTNDDKESK